MITGADSSGGEAAGFNLALTLPTSFTPDAGDKVRCYTGSGTGWDCATSGYDAVGNTVTRVDITHLSDWAVADRLGCVVGAPRSPRVIQTPCLSVKTKFQLTRPMRLCYNVSMIVLDDTI